MKLTKVKIGRNEYNIKYVNKISDIIKEIDAVDNLGDIYGWGLNKNN